MELDEKYSKLKEYLIKTNRVAVAFSGGVDSTFLLKVAHEVLGDNVIAITAISSLFPRRELEETVSFCEQQGIKQIVIEPEPLAIEGFCENPKDRCYICKKAIFAQMKEAAHDAGEYIPVEGSNIDDLGDYRPGLKAIQELGVDSPLRYAELTKSEIRSLSKKLGLVTWQKPSYACLASRIPYGDMITVEKLAMVELAEQLLRDLGFVQMRVRVHGNMARIEVLPEDISRLIEENIRQKVLSGFKKIGFLYVTIDMEGYRTGSLNEALGNSK